MFGGWGGAWTPANTRLMEKGKDIKCMLSKKLVSLIVFFVGCCFCWVFLVGVLLVFLFFPSLLRS